MRNIIFKSMVRFTNNSVIFNIFLIFNPNRKCKILHFFNHTFIFSNHILRLCKSLADACHIIDANINVKMVDTMLFKEIKHCL